MFKTDLFKSYVSTLTEQLKTKDLSNLTGQLNITRQEVIKLIAYEHVIRDRALDNLNLTGRLFFDHKNSRTSYASQIQDVLRNYPQLMDEFTVLDALEFRSRTITGNVKERNIKLKDTRVSRETLEIFESEIVRLGDNSELLKVKGISEEDASMISALFKRFHVFAYLQSAANPSSSTFNLLPIANPMVIEQLLAKPVQDFIEMNTEEQYDIADKVFTEVKKYHKDYILDETRTKVFNRNKLYTHKALNIQRVKKKETPKDFIFKNNSQKVVLSIKIDEQGKAIEYTVENTVHSKDVITELNGLKDEFALVIGASTTLFETGEIPKSGIGQLLNSDATLGLASENMTDAKLENNKLSIDGSIENIKESLGDRQVVFRDSGYAQELIKKAPKTFEYLSRRLKEEFGYTNPGSVPENVQTTEPVQIDTSVKVISPEKVSVPLTSLDIYNSIIDEIKSCGI